MQLAYCKSIRKRLRNWRNDFIEQGFFDGNKRIGIYAMLVFLELNGMEMECSEEELIALGLGIASGKIEEKDVGIWIVTHNRG